MAKDRKRDTVAPLCAIKLIECSWADDAKTFMRLTYDAGGGPPVTRLMSEGFAREIAADIGRLLQQKAGNVRPIRAGDWPGRH
jgi:hypothetical protein